MRYKFRSFRSFGFGIGTRVGKLVANGTGILALIGPVACGGPAAVEVSSTGSRLSVSGTVLQGLGGEVKVRAQEGSTPIWREVSLAPLTVPTANNYLIEGPSYADWSAPFRLPPWAWRPGVRGSYARFFVEHSEEGLLIEPFDQTCISRGIRTGDVDIYSATCRFPKPAWNVVSTSALPYKSPGTDGINAALKRTGFYFHACTKDFLPEGYHRRSYCDRPSATVATKDGTKTEVLYTYQRTPDPILPVPAPISQSPIESVTWVGDGATLLAFYDTAASPDRARYVPYWGTRDQALPMTVAASSWDDRVSLVDLGECSSRVGWGLLMNGFGDVAGFVERTPAIIEEEVEKDCKVVSAKVSNLRIVPKPSIPSGGPPDSPRYFRAAPLQVNFHLFADVQGICGAAKFAGWFDADLKMLLNLDVCDAGLELCQAPPGVSSAKLIKARIDEMVIQDLHAGGRLDKKVEEKARNSINGFVGKVLDLTESFESYDGMGNPTALFGRDDLKGLSDLADVKRIVSTYRGLHFILAEDASDWREGKYLEWVQDGLCRPAIQRLGSSGFETAMTCPGRDCK